MSKWLRTGSVQAEGTAMRGDGKTRSVGAKPGEVSRVRLVHPALALMWSLGWRRVDLKVRAGRRKFHPAFRRKAAFWVVWRGEYY